MPRSIPSRGSFLWAHGLDFDHGTGHGVGAGLSVHEGPARISKLGHVPLKPGMILSNEPGYYRAGAYGIRIENLVVVEPRSPGGDRPSLGFGTLTLVPYDRRLIETALLTPEEIAFIDDYHRTVADAVGPLVAGGAGLARSPDFPSHRACADQSAPQADRTTHSPSRRGRAINGSDCFNLIGSRAMPPVRCAPCRKEEAGAPWSGTSSISRRYLDRRHVGRNETCFPPF